MSATIIQGSSLSAQEKLPLVIAGFVVAFLVLAASLTYAFPFIDFNAHIVRHAALADLLFAHAPTVAASYSADIKLVPNLGADVIGILLNTVFEPTVSARFLAGFILLLHFASVIVLSRVIHGSLRIEAVCLAGFSCLNFVLFWGFINFCLGFSLALCGMALWLTLEARPRLQLLVSAIFAVLLLLVHGLSFALWGVMLGGLELGRLWQSGTLFSRALPVSVARLALLAVIPAILFINMPTSSATGQSGGLTNAISTHLDQGTLIDRLVDIGQSRINAIMRVTESRWAGLDYVLNGLVWLAVAAGLATGWLAICKRMWPPLLIAAGLVFLSPPSLFGVGVIGDRMPLVLLVLLAASIEIRAYFNVLSVFLGSVLVARLASSFAGFASANTVYEDFSAKLRNHKVEAPATTITTRSIDRTSSDVACSPLAPLMFMEQKIAVPTFAFASQQPIRLEGELKAATEQYKAARYEMLEQHERYDHRALARAAFDGGFRTVVLCGTDQQLTPLPGSRIITQGAGWLMLFRTDDRLPD